MADQSGYIKIDRNLLNWRWIATPNTAHLFIILLLKANYKEMDFQGIKIQRGQLVTSLPSLSKQSGLTINEVRTALLHLICTGEITNKSYTKYRIITIPKYDEYQNVTDKIADKSQTDHRQTTDKSQTNHSKRNKSNTSKQERKKENIGRSAPGFSSSRNSAEPKANLLKQDGTVEDIPEELRDTFKTYDEYRRSRQQ